MTDPIAAPSSSGPPAKHAFRRGVSIGARVLALFLVGNMAVQLLCLSGYFYYPLRRLGWDGLAVYSDGAFERLQLLMFLVPLVVGLLLQRLTYGFVAFALVWLFLALLFSATLS